MTSLKMVKNQVRNSSRTSLQIEECITTTRENLEIIFAMGQFSFLPLVSLIGWYASCDDTNHSM